MEHLSHLPQVASLGIALVTHTTKYLSTLPQPIEVVEELVSVVAVTSTLLHSLSASLVRFPGLATALSPQRSFLGLLCEDVARGFRELEERVKEARVLRVFEPNDVGLVRMPRNAWVLVMKGEQRAAALRNRLYVEKYRVRVLIEAVCWVGLGAKGALSEVEMGEQAVLRRMLPLVVERLGGVRTDYVPRLKALTGTGQAEKEAVDVEVGEETVSKPVVSAAQEKNEVVKAFRNPEPALLEMPLAEKRSIRSCASTSSLTSFCSSSITVTDDDSIQEVWLLRRNEETKNIKQSFEIFGVRCFKGYSHKHANFYVKPVPSCPSEIKMLRVQSRGALTEADHQARFRKQILKMPDDAQWEIQKLIESREKASSNAHIKREFQVVAFVEKPRRKITPKQGTTWWSGGKKGLVEWLLVLRGETTDHWTRTVPGMHEDAWNPKPKTKPQPPQMGQPIVMSRPPRAPIVATPVLTHVENRCVMTVEEAEKKMEEMVKELFWCKED